MINILYLVSKDYYKTKMSRVRFHSMDAIGKIANLTVCGIGWRGWDNEKTCQENVDLLYPEMNFDLVVGFKPLEMNCFGDLKFRKCLRYNEMYDMDWTISEIVRSGVDVVVCHHYNDYVQYKDLFDKVEGPKKIQFHHIPHSAESTIFKPIPVVKKEYDVILVGATNVQTMLGDHYPLRHRMQVLLSSKNKLTDNYKTAVVPHVGGSFDDAHTDVYAKDFAKTINSSKIVITDSGLPNSRFGKYIEIPACGTAIAGDVYDDRPDDVKRLKEFLIEINMSMTDEQIMDVLIHYLKNERDRFVKIEKGLKYAADFTHEKYAERFLKEVF